MTQFRTFTEDERAALRVHGLYTHQPSQLSDAFVLGLRFASSKIKDKVLVDKAEMQTLLTGGLSDPQPTRAASEKYAIHQSSTFMAWPLVGYNGRKVSEAAKRALAK